MGHTLGKRKGAHLASRDRTQIGTGDIEGTERPHPVLDS